MQRQTSFWLGIFVALIIAIPIIMGVLSNAEDYAIKYSGFLAGIGFCIVFSLILMLFFREPILKRITGSTKAEFVDITEKLVLLFLEKPNESEKAQAVTEITTTFANWYIWTRFYKWVIATCIAILIAAAGFAGSVLLAKQNTIMNLQKDQADLQNDLQIFETQAFIRSQLDTLPVPITEVTEFDSTDILLPLNYPQCEITGALNFRGKDFDAVANSSTMLLVSNLLKQERLKTIVQEALNNLFNDNDSGVAMTSLLILDQNDLFDQKHDVLFANNLGGNYELENYSGSFNLENSAVGIECENCESSFFHTSFIGETNMQLEGSHNIVLWDPDVDIGEDVDFSQIEKLISSVILLEDIEYFENIVMTREELPINIQHNWYGVLIERNGGLNIQINHLVTDNLANKCQFFKNVCQSNPFLNCNE